MANTQLKRASSHRKAATKNIRPAAKKKTAKLVAHHAFENLRDVKSRSEYVYQQVLEAISEGRFRPGMRLGEEEIAQSLGVSRTPVREALRRLQARGLLMVGGGRSLVVAELSVRQVHELYAMREILEGSAARFAATHASEPDLILLRQAHEKFAAASNRPEDLVPLNRRFHQAIYEAAHNQYLTQALNELHDALVLLSGSTFRIPPRPQMSNEEHLAIIEAIEAHDPNRAEAAARKHIRLAELTRFS
jgi:DNA-binding GntR family transcriptional regulator